MIFKSGLSIWRISLVVGIIAFIVFVIWTLISGFLSTVTNSESEIWIKKFRSDDKPRQLTFDRGNTDPLISPDGNDIVYCHRGPKGALPHRYSIRIRNLETNAATDLGWSDYPITDPQWCLGAKAIIYHTRYRKTENKVVNAYFYLALKQPKPSEPKIITDEFLCGDPTITPDGRMFTFILSETFEDKGVYITPVDGGTRKKIFIFTDMQFMHQMAWLANGKALAILNKEGLLVVEIPSLKVLFQSNLIPYQNIHGVIGDPVDSDKLYFTAVARVFPIPGFSIVELKYRTGEMQPVMPFYGFGRYQFTSEGKYIIYSKRTPNKTRRTSKESR